MRYNFVPLVLAALVALAFIGGGYQSGPPARWGREGRIGPISLRSRWILGCCFVGLALVFTPGLKQQLPSSLPMFAVIGSLLLLFLMMLLDAEPIEWRLNKRRRSSALSPQQKKELRRERKRQRLLRTQTRHRAR
jgi:hypothetical protein